MKRIEKQEAQDLANWLYATLSPEDKRLADMEIAVKKRLHIPIFEPLKERAQNEKIS